MVQDATSTGVLCAGNLVLDYERREVRVGPRRVVLTYQEFEALTVLLRTPNTVITYRRFCEALWGSCTRLEVKRLRVIVSRLRHKVEAGSLCRIEVVRSRGYGLQTEHAAPVQPQARAG